MVNIYGKHKRVLIRVDFNVPVHNGKITDLNRVRSALPTINYFLNLNMSVVLMSHFGRPKEVDQQYSLKFLIEPLSKLLNKKVSFCSEISEDNKRLFEKMEMKDVMLLENLRFYPGETSNHHAFAKLLSDYGDIYVNDAFGVSHRKHASIDKIQEYFPKKKYIGFLVEKEYNQLQIIKTKPLAPYTVIVGGSKIGSKIHMLKAFLNVANHILIGGGMAFPFIKYLGGAIGTSLCNNDELDVVQEFLSESKKSTTKIILPKDCVTTSSLRDINSIVVNDIMSIPPNLMGVDIGPKTITMFNDIIINSKSIMWNGPMGVSEIDTFSNGTRRVGETVVKATQAGAYSLIGGGDTVSDISRFGIADEFSYVSTGGGAMLEFFRNENLPGLRGLPAIRKKPHDEKK